MTYTAIAMQLPLPTLIVLGVALLNIVFRPPYYETINFILMAACAGIFYIFVVWAILLNYGVEVYEIPLV